jgi:XRE family transcriptional regulator, regulator of sulfur utilization
MKTTAIYPVVLLFSAGAALALGACAQTPAPTAADTITPKLPLASMVIDTNALPVETTAFGLHRSVFNGPTQTLNNFESHITTVNPGQQAHAPHTHGNEEMLIVKDGTLDVTIKGRTYTAGPGAIIFYESNDLHGTHNSGTVPVTYYVFSWVTDKTPATIPPPGGEPTAQK